MLIMSTNLIFSLHSYMREQVDGHKLYKLVSKRKKVPLTAKDVWRYNRMRKEDIFSKPLIKRKKVPLTAKDGVIDLNLSPSQQMQEEQRCKDGVIDLNLSPSQQMHHLINQASLFLLHLL